MNIGQLKVVCWGGAGVLAAGLALYVGLFVKDLENRRKPPDPNKISQTLESAEAVKTKSADLIPYEDVRRLYLPSCEHCKEGDRHLNWTGKPPEKKTESTPGDENAKPPAVPIAELVKIPMSQVDLSDPTLSRIWLKYRPKAAVQNNGAGGGFWLREGDRLAQPHDYAKIEKIDSQGVNFVFDDANRAPEKVSPDEFDMKTTIVQVDPDGVIRPKQGSIPLGATKPWQPNRTTAYGRDRYMLGTEDILYANENYPKILSEEVRTGRHQDPRTGKYDGIEIQSVTKDSFADRHGAQEGDVVKSINGHPVTSVQEAISYAKMNANQFSTWEIVVERNGRLQTFYYQSPQ
jgi:hypothetical protein